MKKIPSGVKLTGLYLIVNVVYLCLVGNINFLRADIILGPFLPLTKLWLTTLINFAGFNGFEHFMLVDKTVLWVVLLVLNALAFAGILSLKNWGRRILVGLLLATMIWVASWLMLSDRALESMDVYMHRSYNASLYNQYWHPLRLQFCPVVSAQSRFTARQYEPMRPLSGTYRADEKFLKSKLPAEIRALAPAYWSIFKVGEDAFDASAELFAVLLAFVRAFLLLWFVVVPAVIIYYFTCKEIKEVFDGPPPPRG